MKGKIIMENKIVTMASRKFGTVRKIYEGNEVIFCGADIAKALGYSNVRDALAKHCRCVAKRDVPHPQSNSKQIEMSFIPESDVYRLICHSKLPSAMEFEKWVFEDVVPKAVDKQLNTKPEQFTLETAEYHYFDKTYNGTPVITLDDFEYFTGIPRSSCYFYMKRLCRQDEDYHTLSGKEVYGYKQENPNVNKLTRTIIVLKASAVRKLLDYFKKSADVPILKMGEKKVAAPAKAEHESVNDCVITLETLGFVRDILKSAENTEAVKAINVAIKYTAWELSKRATC